MGERVTMHMTVKCLDGQLKTKGRTQARRTLQFKSLWRVRDQKKPIPNTSWLSGL